MKNNSKWVLISINDQGVGMSNSRISAILENSKLSPKLGTAEEKGSGMGLQICKNFISRHNGQLNIESRPDNGSCFTFSLPQTDLN